MKGRIVWVLLIYMVSLPGCDLFNGNKGSVNSTDRTAEASFSFTIATQNRGLFLVEAINGSIEVIGSPDQDTISIEGVRIVGSESSEDAEDYLRELEVEVKESNNEIRVETIQPNETGGRRLIVDYEIRLPDNFQTNISQINGTITVEGMRRNLDAELVNGDLQLIDIISSTDISVVNGTIESEMALPFGGALSYSVVNGQIALEIPDTTSAEFSARVVNGSISLSGLTLSDPNIEEHSVTGILGEGNGSIDLEVTNGDIEVTAF